MAPIETDAVGCLKCPDSGEPMEPLLVDEKLSGFLSPSSGYVYPVLDGIVVLLAECDRSYDLEREAVALLPGTVDESLNIAIEKTVKLLEDKRGAKKSWAWEDEEHWENEYRDHLRGMRKDKNWNDRIWQRSYLINRAGVEEPFKGTVLDIGCGEGQNFRDLIQPRCDSSALYIAVDISLSGLRLNREKTARRNALFVLASADNLPIAEGSVDLLCYFGILHHTERKEGNLIAHQNCLKLGGCMLMHEAVQRARVLPDSFRPEESAHEERIAVPDIKAIVNSRESKIDTVFWKAGCSVFYTAIMRLTRSRVTRRKSIYNLIWKFDGLLIKVFGPIIPWLRGGEILSILKRRIS